MPRTRKRPSTVGVDAANASSDSKRPNRNGAQQRLSAPPLFPLPPVEVAVLPTIDSAAVKALETAYGGDNGLAGFPEELLRVFEFCVNECSGKVGKGGLSPVDAFKSVLSPLGLQPCGPFDFLLCYGAASTNDASVKEFDWLTHCRFAHDPPEFVTLFVSSADDSSDSQEYHIGYVRDSPELKPAFLASNDAKLDGCFDWLGDSILQCLALHAHKRGKIVGEQRDLIGRLAKFCQQPVPPTAPSAPPLTKLKCPSRGKSYPYPIVARTLNGLGLCVPLSGDVGYRELPETDASLRRLLHRVADKCDVEPDRQTRLTLLEPVDELVTLVQFANDEGDPGMGLELGLDLLSVPTKIGCYDDLIEGLLVTGYGLVGRPLYAEIVRRHMKVRLRYRLAESADK